MVVMGMESNSARCETLARQIQVHGGPQTIAEIIEKIEAVDLTKVRAAGEALLKGKPTITALGPVAKMPEYDTLVDRLRA
jgi:predicted Zn-dependent peptidase